MVSTIDHLATEAGLGVLRDGGSAADAAIASNAVLAVVAPNLCGMGGDLFALVSRDDEPPATLNAAGRAGSGADAARLRAEGFVEMPFKEDIRSVTVPGCVDGWLALHERFGRLGLDRVLAPAIGYARDGFPASTMLAASIPVLPPRPGSEDLRGPTGQRAPGEVIRRPGVARALDCDRLGRTRRVLRRRVRRRAPEARQRRVRRGRLREPGGAMGRPDQRRGVRAHPLGDPAELAGLPPPLERVDRGWPATS